MSIPFDSALSASSSDSAERHCEMESKEAYALPDSFCAEFAPQATRYAMSITKRWSDAEEIVQESFCRLIQLESDLKTDADARAMLFSVIRNLAIDEFRKNGRRRFEQVDTNQIANTRASTDDVRLEKLENSVQEILQDLPGQWSDALQLKVNGGLSYSEIAKVLKATHSQVRTWIYRARKQLEKDLRGRDLLGDNQ